MLLRRLPKPALGDDVIDTILVPITTTAGAGAHEPPGCSAANAGAVAIAQTA